MNLFLLAGLVLIAPAVSFLIGSLHRRQIEQHQHYLKMRQADRKKMEALDE